MSAYDTTFESRSGLAAEEVLQATFEAATETIWLVDPDGETLLVGGASDEMLGYSPEALRERQLRGLCADGAAGDRALSRSRSEQGTYSEQLSLVTRSGTTIEAEARFRPIRDGGGPLQAIVIMVTDRTAVREAERAMRRAIEELEGRVAESSREPPVSTAQRNGERSGAAADEHPFEADLRRTEAQLETQQRHLLELARRLADANRELEAFSYSVSHDLRAPLRSIDGFSRIVVERYADVVDDRGRDYLGRIRAASQRMGQLITDLLQLGRIGRCELRRQRIDVSALARNVLAESMKSEPDRKVSAAVEDDMNAFADPHLLRLVLENLIENALKFTSKTAEPVIQIGGSRQNGDDVFWVRDNGAGFDMAYSAKLFGAFQRLHTVDEFPGSGIGLATVQRIIHRHGGRTWAEGTVGGGAVFSFSIPRNEGAEEAPA